MADKTLVWFFPDAPHQKLQPTYYAEEDFEKSALRIIADVAPVSDCLIDIFVSNYTGTEKVSIFNNHFLDPMEMNTPPSAIPNTTINLPAGKTVDIAAENFTDGEIAEGQLITCQMFASGGAKNVTVILELNRLTKQSEQDEASTI
jgi:hypothetical protein